jgi:hypothetical protein
MVGDGTPYGNWETLIDTLLAIIDLERDSEKQPWINGFDEASAPPDDKPEMRDNPDHILVGSAVAAVRDRRPEFNYLLFWGYPIGAEDAVFELDSPQVQQKRRLFAAYLSGGIDLVKDYVNAADIYESWLPRSHPV